MLDTKNIKYSYNDVMVLPAVLSQVRSRRECNPFDGTMHLPIFTAPMTSVVGLDSVEEFEKNHIHTILPRSISFEERMKYGRETKRWIALSFTEFENEFTHFKEENKGLRVLIDIANGHMSDLYRIAKTAKYLYGRHLTLMVGNIANPETYAIARDCGIDYIRSGVGGGTGCITSSNSAIHMPMASLIAEMYEIKKSLSAKYHIKECNLPKIVADGNIRNYSDVIKALSLGADYVMIGGVFSTLLGSSGEIIDSETYKVVSNDKIFYKDGNFFMDDKRVVLYKNFYGMASRKGQSDISNGTKKTAEGIEKLLPMTTTIQGWSENMIDYLRSAMSYTNNVTLDGMKDNHVIVVTQAAANAINK